ncbi:tetratricopeptide repeat-containing sulfotransferase family protein [Thalassospira mesophila]|nr:tetratricopeptide repeat-containing sulfotransferase family protein [Thalassospira mesophila]
MKQMQKDPLSPMKQAMAAREFDKAAAIGAKLVRTHPKNVELQLMTSVAELRGTHPRRAFPRLSKLVQSVPASDHHIGMVLQNLIAFARATGDYHSLTTLAEKLHRQNRNQPLFAEYLANVMIEHDKWMSIAPTYSPDLLRAVDLLESIPPNFGRYAQSQHVLAQLYVRVEMVDKALALYEKMVAKTPDDMTLRHNQIAAQALTGKVDPAVCNSLDLIENHNETNTQPYLVVAFLRPQAMPETALPFLEKIHDDTAQHGLHRYNAAFALARTAEVQQDFQTAFGWYQKGHAAHRAMQAYDGIQEASEIDHIIALSEADFASRQAGSPEEILADLAGADDPLSPKPVFIVGLPRSGTTLTERIVGAHSDVYPAGEVGDFARAVAEVVGVGTIAEQMERITPKAARAIRQKYLAAMAGYAPAARMVANKTPANFLRIGQLRKVFPDVPIIHCMRHPLATCLSIYTTPFANPIRFADDLQDLADYYQRYEKIMAAFARTDDTGQIFHLSYEELVADPDTIAPRLLAHCGLDWQAECLEFYRSRQAAKTASLMQVRRPINAESIDKWQRFEPFIGPLAALAGGDDDGGKSSKRRIQAA